MAEINDPAVVAFLNATARPSNERTRSVTQNLDEMIAWYDTHVAPALDGAADADVIVDGRDDSVATVTVGDLKAWIRTMRFLVQVARHRGNVDQNAMQNAFNDFVNADINVQSIFVLLTVRTGLFGD